MPELTLTLAQVLEILIGGVGLGIAIDRLVLVPIVNIRAARLRRHGG